MMLVDIPRILSGNAVAQYVHTVGDPDVDANTRAPDGLRSPSGAFGHDHSGGNYGKPFRRSIATFSRPFRDDTNRTGYNEEYDTGIHQYHSDLQIVCDISVQPDATSKDTSPIIHFYIPPCDTRGAYNELSFSCKIFKPYDNGSLGTSDDIDITLKNISNGSSATFSGNALLTTDALIRDSNDLIAVKAGRSECVSIAG